MLFYNIWAGNYKVLVRIANGEGPDQTALSHLGLHCFSCVFFGRQLVFLEILEHKAALNILQQNMMLLFFTQYFPIKVFDEWNLLSSLVYSKNLKI